MNSNDKFKPSKILHIPTEIFILICEELPPSSLFALSKTCVKYHEYLVSSQIWKTSRERSVPHDTITKFEKKNFKNVHAETFQLLKSVSPPEGMNEYNYFLFIMGEGCQFCRSPVSSIYWFFQVRCCKNCLSARTIIIKEPNLHDAKYKVNK